MQIQQHAGDSSAPLYQAYLHTCQVTGRKMALRVEAISCRQTERNPFQESSRWSHAGVCAPSHRHQGCSAFSAEATGSAISCSGCPNTFWSLFWQQQTAGLTSSSCFISPRSDRILACTRAFSRHVSALASISGRQTPLVLFSSCSSWLLWCMRRSTFCASSSPTEFGDTGKKGPFPCKLF